MVDSQSQYRMYGCHYNYTPPRRAVKTARDVHRMVASYTAPNTIPVADHDCRAHFLRQFTDQQDWRAFVLGLGMKTTVTSTTQLHDMPAVKVRPEKLLTSVGQEKGSGTNEFNFPRSLAFDSMGDVYVTDSLNHRLQVYNGFGVYKHSLGDGDDGLDFKEPSGVALFPNDDLAVADRRNKRVRVLASDGTLKFDIETRDEPYSVVCDCRYNLIVSTYRGTLELYRRGGTFYRAFPVADSGCPIVCNDSGDIIVSNIDSKKIEFYNHRGKKLHEFKPESCGKGLGVVNAGISLDSEGRILVCDSLNHTISVYSERGVLLNRHLGPTDDLGTVQACSLGPQGHLAAVEFSSSGRHCLKVFRYTDCQCHLYHKSPADE